MHSTQVAMDVIRLADEPQADELRASLMASALRLVDDPVEAGALVALVLEAAREEAPLGQAGHFRLLRRAYHSIERSRPRRRARDAAVTALAAEPSAPRTEPGD